MEMNEILDRLPKHLLELVIDQPYNEYTAQDHAVWRYVMRRNISYLGKVAHESYLTGLQKTGITVDRIPHMYGMNRILKEIAWAAVAVDGFIPPAAFMEFQAFNVLVIAADIRPIDQILYTPAPDIIHEAAGHAPIIADPEYAEYLRKFGMYGSKAFSSAHDHEMYEAIRHLSILKADPYTPGGEILKAENYLSLLEKQGTGFSEMTQIRNLHWWTVEYGLIGDLKNPKIYGAGLLSSIGESFRCLQDDVIKLPYTLDAVNYNFDITTMQPQLFVTPDFKHLTDVLEEYTNRLAYRRGGVYGMEQAVQSGKIATAVFSSGLQVSGVFDQFFTQDEQLAYIHTTGPTALSFNNQQLPAHGKNYHAHGFGSPAGKLKGYSKPLELMNSDDLKLLNIIPGKKTVLEFESGVVVEGVFENKLEKEGRNLIMTFTDCTVKFEDRILFIPSWGLYDMAVGIEIVSTFPGAADPDSYEYHSGVPHEKTHKIQHSQKASELHKLYDRVREIREKHAGIQELRDIYEYLKLNYPSEWLLLVEIHELAGKEHQLKPLAIEVENRLSELAVMDGETGDLIENGLRLNLDVSGL